MKNLTFCHECRIKQPVQDSAEFFFFVIVAAEKHSILLRLFSQLAVRLAERFLAENYPDLRSRTCAELFCALFSVNETF